MMNAVSRIWISKRDLIDGEVVKQKRNPFSPQATQYIIWTQWTLSETKIEAINLRLLSLTQCRWNRGCSQSYISQKQSHYIKVAQGDIFMEQKIRFGLIDNTGKKIGVDYEQLLRVVFSCFWGKKIIQIFF